MRTQNFHLSRGVSHFSLDFVPAIAQDYTVLVKFRKLKVPEIKLQGKPVFCYNSKQCYSTNVLLHYFVTLEKNFQNINPPPGSAIATQLLKMKNDFIKFGK